MRDTDPEQQRHSGNDRRSILYWAIDNRFVVSAAVDGVFVVIGVAVATVLRYDFDMSAPNWARVTGFMAIAVGLQWAAGTLVGLYTGGSRYGSFDEVAALTLSAVWGTSVAALMNRFILGRPVPVSVGIGYGGVALILMAGVRYGWRLDRERRNRPDADTATKVVVYGAGEGGHQIVTSMLRNTEGRFYPVALVDDDPLKTNYRISGVRVEGPLRALPEVAKARGAEALVVAIPSAGPEILREADAFARSAGLSLFALPSVDEMLDSTVRIGDIQPVSEEELLGRGHVDTDVDGIAGYLQDKRVLVTGAGGSIGSELCRQIHRFDPAELIMLDRDESLLHAVQLSIDGRGQLECRSLVVADIRDRERMAEVFAEWKPEVVFHAAALKHVPLLEMHPDEGYKTNVLGTQNVLDCAADSTVERFVNISTDKAAAPINVLGRTKREAEQRTAAIAATTHGTFMSVRFGNVLGSRGSVLTTFREQIARGGPVTVTHPEVSRYFMTISEAVQLVIQAGAIGQDGEILILDMGEPVKIAEVAKRMVAAADRDVEIEYTGLRDGEKMHEILMDDSELGQPGPHSLITHVKAEVAQES